MKTKISTITAAAFFALFIFTGNAKADGIEKNASSHENIEAVLTIEPWMINETIWETGETNLIEEASETTLNIECWMIDETIWNINPSVIQEEEKVLEIEPWMTDESIWN